ncbi:polymer-forming protein [Kushneria sinocarnis]|uniref:Polymer-forming protein n=1 Tax=Kushneria sinocarnis TaxID=595502 RepID=A0A420WXR2_9GAMM|nr:polymer-forming cytoskeletal protein [Kushneria sinocarnis]RKR04462.1 polymer-forming protein [Kushneria sinocarnis]
MDTLQWLLLPGILAILLILLDGYRRTRRAPPEDDARPEPAASADDAAPLDAPLAASRAAAPPRPAKHSAPLPASAEACRREPATTIADTGHAGSYIGPGVRIHGCIHAEQPLTVAGRVEGEIRLPRHGVAVLAPGEAGPLITAHRLVADGRLNGEIHIGESAVFHEHARFTGRLVAARLRCVKGATLSGQFSIG